MTPSSADEREEVFSVIYSHRRSFLPSVALSHTPICPPFHIFHSRALLAAGVLPPRPPLLIWLQVSTINCLIWAHRVSECQQLLSKAAYGCRHWCRGREQHFFEKKRSINCRNLRSHKRVFARLMMSAAFIWVAAHRNASADEDHLPDHDHAFGF